MLLNLLVNAIDATIAVNERLRDMVVNCKCGDEVDLLAEVRDSGRGLEGVQSDLSKAIRILFRCRAIDWWNAMMQPENEGQACCHNMAGEHRPS